MKAMPLTWLIAVAMMILCSCSGTMSNGRRWGEDATLAPGWEKVGEAAWNTLKSMEVWVPAAGALALQVVNGDERISDWARKRHPLFKDESEASDASGDLRAATYVAYGFSVLATPSGPPDLQWGVSKAKGLGVGMAAYSLTDFTTEYLKNSTHRDRPDSGDDRSFPSGHTSQAAIYSILADRNLRATNLPRWAKITSKAALTTLPLATGWARVEAAEHYPSDILAGMAIGHFFGIFITDAFMGIDKDLFRITIQTGEERYYAGFAIRY